jgi:predicted GIY-YIG superfamily endonuclease
MPSRQSKWVYNISCDCGRFYMGKISSPLEVHIKEHKYDLTQSLLKKSKLAQCAYEEDHKICRKELKVLQMK